MAACRCTPVDMEFKSVEMSKNTCPLQDCTLLKPDCTSALKPMPCKGSYIHVHAIVSTNRTLHCASKKSGLTCHAAGPTDRDLPTCHGGRLPPTTHMSCSHEEHAGYQCLGCKRTWSSLFALGQHTGSPYMRGTACGNPGSIVELLNVPRANLATGLTMALPLNRAGTQGRL